ncbi:MULTISPECIES: GlsB/YeaQ/YmgE family stress response membrane protein [unclassified Dyella]|jgi:uncharacterized membrane protein YeaQ/YmgE (transglycosylase-associated protein family)|uniref:GlsB/YeaQ/YmgE family stress response membrane protein n=1 Tax=unclassified Dyella TaxID=2634549 RepID=UPI003F92C056
MAEYSLLLWIILGALAGCLASVLVKSDGYGLFIDILIGVLGACLGGGLAHLAGISVGDGYIASVVTAILGAIALLLMLRVFKQWMR